MNNFGGYWTKEKIEIVIKYTKAYLTIMHKTIQSNAYAKDWKLAYFDGFAGSGNIQQDSDIISDIETESTTPEFLHDEAPEIQASEPIKGVATRVLELTKPREFDMYVFVELNNDHAIQLRESIKSDFPLMFKKSSVYQENFNDVIARFAVFLNKNKQCKCLAFIDPYGMAVNWKSIELLKGLSIDVWMLIPTGVGVNRLLKKDGQINESWLKKLKTFIGLSESEIRDNFYTISTEATLFGENTSIKKAEDAIEKAHKLYKKKLETVFKHVSEAYVMRNKRNSILYHFVLASNNKTAVKIANDLVVSTFSKLKK